MPDGYAGTVFIALLLIVSIYCSVRLLEMFTSKPADSTARLVWFLIGVAAATAIVLICAATVVQWWQAQVATGAG